MKRKLSAGQSPKVAVAATLAAVLSLVGHPADAVAQGSTTASWELGIVEAMDQAEKHAISARMADVTVEENIAKSRSTMASMGPQVSLESLQAWNSSSVNKMVGQSIGSSVVPDRISTASIVVGQPLVPLGPLYMKLQADLTSVEVARLDARQSKRNARFSGAEAYIRALKADQFLAIAESSLNLVEKQRRDGEALSRAGKLTNVDMLRLDMALADAKTQSAQARNLRELAFIGLSETIGAPDYRRITLKETRTALYEAQPVATQNREILVDAALRNRAEISAAEARVEMAEYYKKASDFDYLPMVNAFLKYERDLQKDDLVIPGPTGRTFKKEDIRDTLTYGLNIKWNLWDWGGRWFRSSEMAASVLKARMAQEQIESGIRIEATQAALDLEYALAALDTSKTALKLAEETYKQQNVRFESGSATVTDIITAERDLTRARGGLSNAQGDLDLAWLKLLRVTAQDPQSKSQKP